MGNSAPNRNYSFIDIKGAAAQETIAAIDHLFPKELEENFDEDLDGIPETGLGEQTWSTVKAQKTGYIESIDEDSLLALARAHGTILRMERGIGEFVVKGSPLVSVAGSDVLDEDLATELNEIYVIGRHRTVQQDAAFGIRQIVDIAMKALSPGINDTTTAVMCVDYLGAILAQLAVRRISNPHRFDQGELRVIARGPSFKNLLAEAFDQIRQNAGGNVAVLTRQLQALETIAGQTVSVRRMTMLRYQADLISDVALSTIPSPQDGEGVKAASVCLFKVLDAPCREHASASEEKQEIS
ncbi:DUF2254 domain-containing protein [Planctomicrobium sp. SH661]|uniref:DUF2254 domain-containing protein n=1 Tax=Planctomicrobium sp. SH661 TaxID=3448124 RepID=UPI003F5AFC61